MEQRTVGTDRQKREYHRLKDKDKLNNHIKC